MLSNKRNASTNKYALILLPEPIVEYINASINRFEVIYFFLKRKEVFHQSPFQFLLSRNLVYPKLFYFLRDFMLVKIIRFIFHLYQNL